MHWTVIPTASTTSLWIVYGRYYAMLQFVGEYGRLCEKVACLYSFARWCAMLHWTILLALLLWMLARLLIFFVKLCITTQFKWLILHKRKTAYCLWWLFEMNKLWDNWLWVSKNEIMGVLYTNSHTQQAYLLVQLSMMRWYQIRKIHSSISATNYGNE